MSIYGQEKDNATWALAKMNMILHGMAGYADVRKGNSISSPQFTAGTSLKTFDYVVMNPPFSDKAWSNGVEEEFGRFVHGRPPEKNGDFACLLHALTSLKSMDGGSHSVWGVRRRLKVVERPGRTHLEVDGERLVLYTPSRTTAEQRRGALDRWYREQLRDALPSFIAEWEQRLDVSVPRWTLRRMKTKWGSCNRETRHIWFNVELAKKHPDCLEYIVVHEMAHFFERTHGDRFTVLMDKLLRDWRNRRDELNGSPLTQEEWA